MASGATAIRVVELPDDDRDIVLWRVDQFRRLGFGRRGRDVLGVTLAHPAVLVARSAAAGVAAAVERLRGRPGDTFAIRARRRDKRFPVGSHELATLAGRAVQDELGLGVDLD